MKDGYTMAIGGLIRTQTIKGGSKVPVLGDIPLLGRLFKSDTKSKDVNNLIIFITAKTLSAQGSPSEEIIGGDQIRNLEMRRDELPGYRGGPDATNEYLFSVQIDRSAWCRQRASSRGPLADTPGVLNNGHARFFLSLQHSESAAAVPNSCRQTDRLRRCLPGLSPMGCPGDAEEATIG